MPLSIHRQFHQQLLIAAYEELAANYRRDEAFRRFRPDSSVIRNDPRREDLRDTVHWLRKQLNLPPDPSP